MTIEEKNQQEWDRLCDKYPIDLSNDLQCWLWCKGRGDDIKYWVDIENKNPKETLYKYCSQDIFDFDNLITNKLKELGFIWHVEERSLVALRRAKAVRSNL